MSGAMAAQVTVESWQQLVLASLAAVLVALVGWISFGPKPDSSEEAEQEKSRPLPIFGANFTKEALKEARQGGRKGKKGAKKAAKKVVEEPVEEAAEEEQEEEAPVEEEAAVEEEVEEPVEEEPVPEPTKSSKKKKKGTSAPVSPEKPAAAAPKAVEKPAAAAPKAEEKKAKAPKAAAELAPAPVVEEVQLTAEQKSCQNEIRKIQKKLREVTDLKARQAGGDALTAGQEAKVSQEAVLTQTLQDAEMALEEAMKVKEESPAPVPEAEAPQAEPEEAFTEQALVEQVVAEDLHFPEEEEPEEFQQTKASKKKKNRSQRKQQQVEEEEEEEEEAPAEEQTVEAEAEAEADEPEQQEEAAEEEVAEEEEEEEAAEEEAAEEEAAEEEAPEEEAPEEEATEEEAAEEAAEEEEEEAAAPAEEEAGEAEAEADDAAGESHDTTTSESDETKEEDQEDQEAQPAAAEEAEEDEEEEKKPVAKKVTQPKDWVKPTYPATEKEKEMMKLKKKIREIEDLERKQQEGTKLASNQEAKLLKKAGLVEELEVVEASIEPHTIEWSATVVDVMNPMFGLTLKVDGRTETMPLSAAFMKPPIAVANLGEISNRYSKGQDLKVRIRRDGATCTDMSVEEEDFTWQESETIAAELKTLKEEDEKATEELWNQGTWSDEEYTGTVVAVKDSCIFVRVMGAREVRVSAADMSSKFVMKDPISKVSKTKRDAVTVDMEVSLRLRYDYRNERIMGSMIVQVQNAAV